MRPRAAMVGMESPRARAVNAPALGQQAGCGGSGNPGRQREGRCGRFPGRRDGRCSGGRAPSISACAASSAFSTWATVAGVGRRSTCSSRTGRHQADVRWPLAANPTRRNSMFDTVWPQPSRSFCTGSVHRWTQAIAAFLQACPRAAGPRRATWTLCALYLAEACRVLPEPGLRDPHVPAPTTPSPRRLCGQRESGLQTRPGGT